ncbi:MAG: hypothetical protein ABXS91_01665 [Sulfurimonas sp.]
MSVKHFIVLMVVSTTLVAQTCETNKTYDIKSGEVSYEIYGGGVVTPECNLSIEGYEKLSFRAWGDERIESMERTERLFGTLQSVEKEKTLKKSTKDTLYTVDFENERIITTNLIEGDIGQVDLSHMKMNGTMNIASYECELWEDGMRSVCLYKGIVLLDEKWYLGFVYGKRATHVNFDLNLSEEDFELPDYPLKEELLMRNMIKTTQTYKAESISGKIIHADNDTITATDKGYQKAVNLMVEELFEKEKQYLPLLLKSMRKTRACLHVAESKSDAGVCIDEISKLQTLYQGERSSTIRISVDGNKQKILDDLDEKIRALKTRIPCINRAVDITDLSVCMK